jgi:ribosome-binding factor A
MTRHTQKMSTTLMRAIQDLLSRGLNDPRVRGLVSVTKVDLSPDLADAQVFCSILPAENAELAMHGLQAAAPHLRRRLSKSIRLRRVPRLTFRLDKSLKKEAKVLADIAQARVDDDRLQSERDARQSPPEESPS